MNSVPRTFFVTRHDGARDWASRHGHTGAIPVKHLDPELLASLQPGDRLLGTLPPNKIADVCCKGARYFHLTMEVPEELRGKSLSADDMDALGARLEEFVVTRP